MHIDRTSKGLMGHVFDELERLRNGDSNPQHAAAVSRLANTACQITRLEMDFARFVSAERADKQEGLAALPMQQAARVESHDGD